MPYRSIDHAKQLEVKAKKALFVESFNLQTWYVKHNGKAFGPIAPGRLKELVRNGKIVPNSSVRLGDEGKWVPASSVKGLFAVTSSKAKAVAKSIPSQADPVEKTIAPPATPKRSATEAKPAEHLRETGNPYSAPIHSQATGGTTQEYAGGKHRLSEAFLTIWFQPRKTIRWLIDERNPREAILLISIVFGLKYLDNALIGEDGSIAFALFSAPIGVPFSALIGILFLYLLGVLDLFIGQMLGGEGDGPDIRTALAWSFVPAIISFGFTLLLLVVDAATSPTFFIPTLPFNIVFLLLGFWGLAIQVAGLSVAHRFSVLRAISTLLLSFFVILLLFMLLVQVAVTVALW